MASYSTIEWCDATFNGWIGCTKISPACDHCYAERATPSRRFGVKWGSGQPRRRTCIAYWNQPLRWNAEPFYACDCGYRGTLDELTTNAIHRCGLVFRPTRRRVFCASLADVFDNEVDPRWRADLFSLIRATPNLDWLLLTKRIGNATAMIADAISSMPRDTQCGMGQWNHTPLAQWPWPNVWIGATICNQVEADRDIPKLLALPARVRFLSMEPLLGPVELRHHLFGRCAEHDFPGGFCLQRHHPGVQHVHWVIAGGESGSQARPMHPDWVRSLRDQCAGREVPFLFKQWGHWAPDETHPGRIFVYSDGSTDIPDWRVADPACEGETAMSPLGKKNAGRKLDGAEHLAFPLENSDGKLISYH